MTQETTAPIGLDPEAAARIPGLWCAGVVVQAGPATGEGLPEPSSVLDPAWGLDTLKDLPVAAGYRRFSWSLGIDPTKDRPSGEALARRILGGKELPKIHPLVDAYNLASARTLVPLSAYDLDRFAPPLVVRVARQGETFHGIGRDPAPLDAGRIVNGDADGRIAGVVLWRDGVATTVGPTTQRALLFAVGADPVPPRIGVEALDEAVAFARRVGFIADGPPAVVSG